MKDRSAGRSNGPRAGVHAAREICRYALERFAPRTASTSAAAMTDRPSIVLFRASDAPVNGSALCATRVIVNAAFAMPVTSAVFPSSSLVFAMEAWTVRRRWMRCRRWP